MLQGLVDPTSKAAQEFSNLGLIVVNNNSQLQTFAGQLDATATAAGKAPVAFDGTLTSLKMMYDQAVKLGAIHTDKSFLEWATSLGIVSSQLYDANGHLKSLPDILNAVSDALQKLPNDQLRMLAEGNLFNIKAGQGARLILSDPNASKEILADQAGVTNAQKTNLADQARKQLLADFNVKVAELNTSFQSLIALIGMPILNAIKPWIDKFNEFVGTLQSGHEGAMTKIPAKIDISAPLF